MHGIPNGLVVPILNVSICKHDVLFRQDGVHQIVEDFTVFTFSIQIIEYRL